MQKIEKIAANMIRNHPGFVFISIFFFLIIIGATAFHLTEGRSWFNSFYYAFIVMTTVGFGDIVPTTILGKTITIFYGFIGIPMFIVGSGIVIQKFFYVHFKKYIAKLHQEIENEKQEQQEIKKELEEMKQMNKAKNPRWKNIFKK